MSKIGPHVIKPTGDALDWARVAPVVKALDDTTALKQSPRATVRIFRRYFPDQNVGLPGGAIVEAVLRALGDAPATHVEAFNECFQRLGQGLERHVDFTAEAVVRLRQLRPDLTLVGYCFSTGQPEQTDWDYLRQHEYGGATCIGIHEYWGGQGFTPWHALRHRTAHEWTQGDHPLFLITECGRDRVEGGKGGWKADGLTREAYYAELQAYEQELLKDPYVIAATPFTGGPTPDWENFTTDPLSGWLAAAATPLPPTPEVPTVPDVSFGVPTVTRITPAHGPPRATTLGVVIHSTRSGTNNTLEQEYRGTVAYFMRPDGDSAHAVVGPAEVTRMVHDDDASYHAQENNRTHLGIEVAQPLPTTAYTDRQYELAAAVTRAYCDKYGIPKVRVMSQAVRGIIGHEDSEQGKRNGKSDPGARWDWDRFIRLVRGETMPTDPTALRDQAYALADQLQKLGPSWEAAGYPQTAEYCRTQGEAIKKTLVIGKGEK